MDLGEIEIEEQKWEDKSFQQDIQDKLCQYVGFLDKILQNRYRNKINNLSPDERKSAIKLLKANGVFNDNLEYVGDSNIVEIDNNARVANGGYYQGKILVNPKSSKQFYSAYRDFLQGKKEGIRDLDFQKPLSELEGISSLETLYWFYVNGKTYEEFLKSTMLHEDVHRWTLTTDVFDDDIDIFFIEGLVEAEAREIARENGIEYANCFRNDEVNLINFFNQYNREDRTKMMLSYSKTQCFALMIGMTALGSLEGIKPQEAGKMGFDICRKLYGINLGDKQDSFGKNYREVMANIRPKKSNEIIEFIQNELNKEKDNRVLINETDIGKSVALRDTQAIDVAQNRITSDNKKHIDKNQHSEPKI